MPKYTVTTPESIIDFIQFEIPLYNHGKNIIYIFCKDFTMVPSSLQKAQKAELSAKRKLLASKLQAECKLEYILPELGMIATTQIEKFREIVSFLRKEAYIADADYADLITHVTEVEKALQCRILEKSQFTTAQKESLIFVASPYVEAIIRDYPENGLDAVIKCIILALAGKPGDIEEVEKVSAFNKFSIVNNWTISFFKAKFHGENDRVLSLFSNIFALHKIYHGRANLESTYIRLAPGACIISLGQQRSILIDCIIG